MTACRVLFLAMDAISNSGARAVFSRGNPGVVERTTTVIHGGYTFDVGRNISILNASFEYETHFCTTFDYLKYNSVHHIVVLTKRMILLK